MKRISVIVTLRAFVLLAQEGLKRLVISHIRHVCVINWLDNLTRFMPTGSGHEVVTFLPSKCVVQFTTACRANVKVSHHHIVKAV